MHGQYIKDLSFENPRAPQSLIEQTQPQLTLNVQVTNRQFDAKTFEVALTIEASAKTPKDEPLFMLELVYAGTVTLGEVPQDAFGPLLFIETPRLLFPFARAVVANATREAGFGRSVAMPRTPEKSTSTPPRSNRSNSMLTINRNLRSYPQSLAFRPDSPQRRLI